MRGSRRSPSAPGASRRGLTDAEEAASKYAGKRRKMTQKTAARRKPEKSETEAEAVRHQAGARRRSGRLLLQEPQETANASSSSLADRKDAKMSLQRAAVDFEQFRNPSNGDAKPTSPNLGTPSRGQSVRTLQHAKQEASPATAAKSLPSGVKREVRVKSEFAIDATERLAKAAADEASSAALSTKTEVANEAPSESKLAPLAACAASTGFFLSGAKGRRKKVVGLRAASAAPPRAGGGGEPGDIEDLSPQKKAEKTNLEKFAALPDSPPPPHFNDIWTAVTEMRAKRDAPVDSMGVEAMGALALQNGGGEKEKRFSILVAVMLSSQTKDEQTAACMQRLRDADVLSPEKMSRLSVEELTQLLYGVGFHRNKARFLKEACETILAKHGGDIPPTYEELVQLRGVGPKMANIAVHAGWDRLEGIAVDVHVHRIANRLNWVRTKTPIETQHAVQRFLPRELWAEINLLFVGFGQQICRPVKPLCHECKASQWCPVGRKATRGAKNFADVSVRNESETATLAADAEAE
ncbi:endonuclease III family 1 protein [Besnoitia besnoiti]|uniref:Endonuclease III homolog n=1 Tax=Besnoitia besnoiti TaxID=94643 RepID=A0A2A9M998_BESBE|nr:endonuclease III family 1 protein [Besnoitia besnoiti]PFH32486.1 endonuclease III family 1 protein [Besnoitia besnoiti]